MIITAYLIIDASRRTPALRLTKTTPALAGSELAVKLRIDVPDSVFRRPIPVLELTLPEDVVINPDAELVASVTADAIAEPLRLEYAAVRDGLLDLLNAAGPETEETEDDQ